MRRNGQMNLIGTTLSNTSSYLFPLLAYAYEGGGDWLGAASPRGWTLHPSPNIKAENLLSSGKMHAKFRHMCFKFLAKVLRLPHPPPPSPIHDIVLIRWWLLGCSILILGILFAVSITLQLVRPYNRSPVALFGFLFKFKFPCNLAKWNARFSVMFLYNCILKKDRRWV